MIQFDKNWDRGLESQDLARKLDDRGNEPVGAGCVQVATRWQKEQ